MQMPISFALTPEAQDLGDVQSGFLLSIESQLKLRNLYEYLDSCRAAVDEIRRDLCLSVLEQECVVDFQRASARLEKFYVDADSWGFDSLYEVALGLQMLLLNSAGRTQHDSVRDALRRGLAMVPPLLQQCERDFCWRLAVTDLLDSFGDASTDNPQKL